MQGKFSKIMRFLAESFANMRGGLGANLSPLMIGKKPSKLILSDDKVAYGENPTDDIEVANKKYVDETVASPPMDVTMAGNLTTVGDITCDDLTVSDDLTVGDDLYLTSDSAGIWFGDGQSEGLTHINDSGLTLSVRAGETTTVNEALKISQMSSGTTGNGFGSRIGFYLEPSGDALQENCLNINAKWLIANAGYESGLFSLDIIHSGTLAEGVFVVFSSGTVNMDGDLNVGGGDATIKAADGANATLKLKSDNSDDAGDNWEFKVDQSNQKLIIGNDIASADTYVSLLEITPHATAASSTVTLAGSLAVNGDTISTDGNATFDSGGGITLDSHTGVFKASKAGTEFSVANSSFAGMILGCRVLGHDAGRVGYSITTSFVTLHADATVRFIAPPSGVVEVYVQGGFLDAVSGHFIYFGLSDNATYNTLGAEHEELVNLTDESDAQIIQNTWVISGLTAGDTYNYWFGLKSNSAVGTDKLNYGGTGSGHYSPFIMKVTALPSATADFAVYD